jgi:glycosyltransferase involved in cell wall biosynthesis
VIIPTYNRSWRLKAAVESFLSQAYPRDRYEIILADNNSTDDTREVIAELARRDERVVALSEPRKGAHFARNSAAVNARGEILYFTDDDMLGTPELLREIVNGFGAGENIGAVTGRVLPRWETPPPQWIIDYCNNELLSLIDRGEGTIVSDTDPGAFSCHQGILRTAFIRAGGFNPDTNAGEFTGDNETGLNIKVKALGYRFAYVGRATIYHVIPGSRMTQRYVNSRFADQGLADSYTAYRAQKLGRARLLRRMLWHSALAVGTSGKAAARRVANDTRWRIDLARVFYFRNRVRYDARLVRSEKWRNFVMQSDWVTGGAAAGSGETAASLTHRGEASA